MLRLLLSAAAALCCLLPQPTAAAAQLSPAGYGMPIGYQAPPGLQWKKIDTKHFEVVFPAGLEADGQRVANTLEHLYQPVSKTLHATPERITVVLANQTTEANGFVTLAPRMTMWFSTPPEEGLLGTGEWYNLLAVHEFRHVAQFDKANTGFVRLMGTLFGETGALFAGALALPSWWWEGDAVGIETALSMSGRGRQPSFDLWLRAEALSGNQPNYMTATLGSYKRQPESPYDLGYLLTSYVKLHFGENAWSEVVRRTASQGYRPLAFSSALRAVTGRNAPALYEDAMQWMKQKWEAQLEGLTFTEGRVLTPGPRKVWTLYLFPQYAADGSIIARKVSLDEPMTFIRLSPDGRENALAQPELSLDPMRVGGSAVVWREQVPDVRWGQRDYGVVRMLDLNTGRIRTVTSRTKFLSPALSPDMLRIMATEFTPEREASLVLLDAQTGREVKRFASPDNDFITAISWSADGTKVVFTRQGTNGKAVTVLDPATGTFHDLMPHSFENVDRPLLHGRYLFYGSAYSGIDNIYALDTETGERFQVTSRRFGAYHPAISPDGTRLLFADYTARGHDIVEMPLDPKSWTPLRDVDPRPLDLPASLAEHEGSGNIFADVPDHVYEIKPYNHAAKLLNVHSWAVVPEDDGWSVGVYSTNTLYTLGGRLGYSFNPNERTGAVEAALSYGGLFPVLDVTARYGTRGADFVTERGDVRDNWRELSLGGGFRLPLNLSRGATSHSLELGVHAARTEVREREVIEEFSNGNGVMFPVTYSASLNRARGWTMRRMLPDFSQGLELSYRHTPFAGDYTGAALTATGHLAFPGLRRSHSLLLQGGFESQEAENYRFESVLRFPRGHAFSYQDRLAKASIDYLFPIAYPDFSLGEWLHVPRIQSSVFYDHAEGRLDGAARRFQSAGVELTAQTSVFSLPLRLNLGGRIVHRFDTDTRRVEFVVGF